MKSLLDIPLHMTRSQIRELKLVHDSRCIMTAQEASNDKHMNNALLHQKVISDQTILWHCKNI